MTRKSIPALILVALAITATESKAQFTANFQTNTISGVTSNWSGDYTVGNTNFLDALIIQSGGVLSDGFGFIGLATGGSNNAAIVNSGIWSNSNDLYVGILGAGNRLIISNGGAVFNGIGYVGYGFTGGGKSDSVLVTGTGSVWSNSSDLFIGYSGTGNQLVITNGGAVFDGEGDVGDFIAGSNNVVTVTGPGSVWNNNSELRVGSVGAGNQMTISSGGVAVNDGNGTVGFSPSSSNNSVVVTGTGSVWSNSFDLYIGFRGKGNQLTITNGGAVFTANGNGYVGDLSNSINNSVVVTGTGSVWSIRNTLYVGYRSASNTLTIAGGSVVVTNAVVNYSSDPSFGIASNNLIQVNSGSLLVTNAASNGALVVSRAGGKGSLLLSGGSVSADALLATNGNNSVVTFNGGLLQTKGTTVSNAQQFVIGNGASAATFRLVGGGTHSFANGLRVQNNATLTGCGTINGTVVIDAGGVVLADCSGTTGYSILSAGGSLTFSGIVTNNGTLRAANDSVLEFYGPVVNNGVIDLINGSTNFHSTFTGTGTVLNASSVLIGQTSVSGSNVVVQIQSLVGHTYQLQITPSLSPPAWTNFYPSQPGTGGAVTFTDPGGATNQPSRLYRIQVTAP